MWYSKVTAPLKVVGLARQPADTWDNGGSQTGLKPSSTGTPGSCHSGVWPCSGTVWAGLADLQLGAHEAEHQRLAEAPYDDARTDIPSP